MFPRLSLCLPCFHASPPWRFTSLDLPILSFVKGLLPSHPQKQSLSVMVYSSVFAWLPPTESEHCSDLGDLRPIK